MSKVSARNKDRTKDQLAADIKEMIRNKVLSTLTKSAGLGNAKIVDIDNTDDFVYGHWMAFILISGSSVRVTLKLHFSNSIAKSMLGNKIKGESDKDRIERVSMDFMKEQCNLMAGSLKTTFNNSRIITGLSIPLVTRGFDEAVFSDKLDDEKINDVWSLEWSGDNAGNVICSSVTEILQIADFKNFSFDDDGDDDEGVFL